MRLFLLAFRAASCTAWHWRVPLLPNDRSCDSDCVSDAGDHQALLSLYTSSGSFPFPCPQWPLSFGFASRHAVGKPPSPIRDLALSPFFIFLFSWVHVTDTWKASQRSFRNAHRALEKLSWQGAANKAFCKLIFFFFFKQHVSFGYIRRYSLYEMRFQRGQTDGFKITIRENDSCTTFTTDATGEKERGRGRGR